jgi:alkylation response protein AidB-like acyl-CoA dehydrogenase
MPGPTPEIPWRVRARDFAAREIAPHADRIEREDELPRSIRTGLAREGFMGLSIAHRWGGREGTTRDSVDVLTEISRASAAAATLLAVHLSVASAPIARWGTDAQRARYLPSLASGRWLGAFGLTEPGAGSDAAAIACRYRRADGGFALDGTKMFITNAAQADVVLVFATSDRSAGAHGISAFVVERGTPGVSATRKLDKLGLRGSETVEIVLRDVRVGPDALLGPEGQGLALALESLAGGRIGIAACALGVAEAAFEELMAATRARPEDWKRSALARSYAEVLAARGLVDRAAARKDAGEPFVEEASAAKLFASRAAVGVSAAALECAHSDGRPPSERAARVWRDARVFPIVEGTTEIQELILGRSLLKD